MQLEETIKKLKQYLSYEDEVVFAFLYGSYAKRNALRDSDLDIAVYIKEYYSSVKVDEIWDKLQKITKKDVENKIDPQMNKALEILKN